MTLSFQSELKAALAATNQTLTATCTSRSSFSDSEAWVEPQTAVDSLVKVMDYHPCHRCHPLSTSGSEEVALERRRLWPNLRTSQPRSSQYPQYQYCEHELAFERPYPARLASSWLPSVASHASRPASSQTFQLSLTGSLLCLCRLQPRCAALVESTSERVDRLR